MLLIQVSLYSLANFMILVTVCEQGFLYTVRITSVFLQTFQELNSYIKHDRPSLTTLTNTEKRVDLCSQPDQMSVYDNPFYS